MATFEHYRHTFRDQVLELAGGPKRSLLPEFVEKDNKQGAVVYLDAIGPGEDITLEKTRNTKTRKTYEADGTKTLAKWVELHTPHYEVPQQRTIAEPYENDWGHTFGRNAKLLEVVDPQNKTVKQGMRSIFKSRDKLIVDAIGAASVARVNSTSTNEVSTVTVNFPATQQIDTAANNVVTLEDISAAVANFEDEWVDDGIFCLVSPQTKKLIIDNNSEVHNTDFVSKSGYFESGNLPDIYGVSFVTSPLMPNDKLYYFCKEAIVYNQFTGFDTDLSEVKHMKLSYQAFMVEDIDCKRVDDLKVIHQTITTTP